MKLGLLVLASLVLSASSFAESESQNQTAEQVQDSASALVSVRPSISILTNVGAETGAGLNLSAETDLAPNFSMGVLLNGTFISGIQGAENAKLLTVGLNPKVFMKRGGTRFGLGGIVGLQLASSDKVSTRALAVGVNASIDIRIIQSLYFSFQPAYLHALVEDGADASELVLAAGVSVSL